MGLSGSSLEFLRINKKQVQFYAKARLSKIIFSDGMPRSGSTLVFNIIRQVLLSDPYCKLSSGWVKQGRNLPNAPVYLLKTHGLYPVDAWRAWRIVYSYRDPRDALVSEHRKFGLTPSVETVRKWMRDFAFAKKNAHLMVRYESLMDDVPDAVRRIADILEQSVDVQNVIDRLPSDEASDGSPDPTTLYHSNHRTGTARGDWRTVLSPGLQRQIATEFGSWLEEHDYAAC